MQRNLTQLREDYTNKVAVGSTETPVVIVMTGALSPVHKGHIKVLETAKSFMDATGKYNVIRALLSPTHDGYVKSKLGRSAIKGQTRLELAQLSLDEAGIGGWASADGWEVGHPNGFIDFPEVTRTLQKQIDTDAVINRAKAGGRPAIKVFFVCGSDHALRCGIPYSSLPTICLSRPGPEFQNLQAILSQRPEAEGNFVLVPEEMPDVSSTAIRNCKERGDVEGISRLMFPNTAQIFLSL